MLIRTVLSTAILLLPAAPCLGQSPAPLKAEKPEAPERKVDAGPGQKADDEDEVVRVTTKLVRVDAVVTDREGQQVSDLRAEDFKVLEDGRPQEITNFSYVDSASSPLDAVRPTTQSQPDNAARGATRVRRDQVRRTIAVIVDDLGMAFENIASARRVLRAFVDNQVRQGDLVAIIRTGGEVGALQQFSADKRQMRAAVERLRWNPCSRRGITSEPALRGMELPPCSMFKASVKRTIAALTFTVKGMRELPGRKGCVAKIDFERGNSSSAFR